MKNRFLMHMLMVAAICFASPASFAQTKKTTNKKPAAKERQAKPNAPVSEVLVDGDDSPKADSAGSIADPYLVVEQMPEALYNMQYYLRDSLRYPEAAKKAEIEGVVYVSCVITADGQPTQIQVLKGIGYDCDEEAARLISSMSKWNPGKQGGRTVPVKITLPVRFSLSR